MSGESTLPSNVQSFGLQHLSLTTAPVHGGDLKRAQASFPHVSNWLDLSAGLNPSPWPIPAIPESCFQQLPDGYDALLASARAYYGQVSLWPVNGSQQGIELLPQVRRLLTPDLLSQRVAIPESGYAEHGWCWHKAGFEVLTYRADDPEALLACATAVDVLVVINPNNPTGQCFDRETLLACHRTLQNKGGWLLVDEAFVDALPDAERGCSLADAITEGLLVLRSVGKFFGLAGIRSGFVLASAPVLEVLKMLQGPWPVSGVTAYLTEAMLADSRWQSETRAQLQILSDRLLAVLQQGLSSGLNPELTQSGGLKLATQWGQTPLFVSCQFTANSGLALRCQQLLAGQGIWVRAFPEQERLRLGLPATEEALQHLTQALADIAPAFESSVVG